MTFCGYDPAMEAGIHKFGTGLAMAVRGRAAREQVSLSHVAVSEQEEMTLLCAALGKEAGGPRKVALEGLSNFVRGVFLAAAERSRLEGTAFDVAIAKEAAELGALIRGMELKSQSLRMSGESEAMRQLAAWIAKQ